MLTPAEQTVLDIGRAVQAGGHDREWLSPAAIAAIAVKAGIDVTPRQVADSIDGVLWGKEYKTFFAGYHIERRRRPKLEYHFFPRGLN